MDARTVTVTDEYVARPERGADWRDEVEAFAAREGLAGGVVRGHGAVTDAELWFYDQDVREFRSVGFDEPLTVAACEGTVARAPGGDPFARLHAVLARPSGQALAGRLNAATVLTGELHVRAFEEPLERDRTEPTGPGPS